MSSLTTELLARNPDYIYPLVVNLVAAVVPIWASLQVSGARKRVGLKYPAEYFYTPCDENAEKDKFLFNCTQRAHQNLLENFPPFLVAFNVCAATFPRFASAMGVVWVLGRVMYQLGYQKAGPKGRGRGSVFANFAALGLLGGGIYGVVTEYLKVM